MRIALISDIHGNHVALEAVLHDIDHSGVDQIICLGDVASVGPQPREVMATIKSLRCITIQGNHDASMLDIASASDNHIAPLLHPTLAWGRAQLSGDDLKFMASFPMTCSLDLGYGYNMLCFHGSPKSYTDTILSATPSKELDYFFSGTTENILVGGHTHIQMLRRYEGKMIITAAAATPTKNVKLAI